MGVLPAVKTGAVASPLTVEVEVHVRVGVSAPLERSTGTRIWQEMRLLDVATADDEDAKDDESEPRLAANNIGEEGAGKFDDEEAYDAPVRERARGEWARMNASSRANPRGVVEGAKRGVMIFLSASSNAGIAEMRSAFARLILGTLRSGRSFSNTLLSESTLLESFTND